MPDDALVLGAERALDRERVLGAEVVEDVLAALLELVIQVGIVEDRQARVGDGVARELETLRGQGLQIVPSQPMIAGARRRRRFRL